MRRHAVRDGERFSAHTVRDEQSASPPQENTAPNRQGSAPQHGTPQDRVPPGRSATYSQERLKKLASPRSYSPGRAAPESPFGGGSRSGFTPSLFEKGSFQQRKIEMTEDAKRRLPEGIQSATIADMTPETDVPSLRQQGASVIMSWMSFTSKASVERE